MSGGHFQYEQYKIQMIADEIEQLILDNESEEVDQWGYKKGSFYSKEVIDELIKGHHILQQAYIYAQRIDWLVSCDDGPDSFINRLKHDLIKITNQEIKTIR